MQNLLEEEADDSVVEVPALGNEKFASQGGNQDPCKQQNEDKCNACNEFCGVVRRQHVIHQLLGEYCHHHPQHGNHKADSDARPKYPEVFSCKRKQPIFLAPLDALSLLKGSVRLQQEALAGPDCIEFLFTHLYNALRRVGDDELSSLDAIADYKMLQHPVDDNCENARLSVLYKVRDTALAHQIPSLERLDTARKA